ncbi:hypothetical protein Cgig2_003956 [Carnegiea gigantea]|uniref:Dof zinc finger protein n=1 Tax=Carnegiea gigantea TaxID=171969 RepID=A0A9Q1QGS5_9CARY|nr:hypothetical protein Cgig2_003956 [Carnegiea gigantea]
MVFSSVPLYLDPPNWQQHQNQELQANGTGNHAINQHQQLSNIIPPPPPLPQPPLPHHQVGLGGGGGAPPVRPNSMAERARLAKIPPPEAPLKCPRCESTNTKFCYFNNYSLSQPRHFCKTCRRYWTRGGALRNVPVGGGCRRNKRSSGSSKSSSSTAAATTTTTKSSSSSLSTMGASMGGIASGGFMASLQNIAQLGMGNLGLTFAGSTTNPVLLDQLDHHYHQVPNFPSFLGGFEIPGSSSTSFQNVVVGGDDDDQGVGKGSMASLTSMSSMMGVKMEDGQGSGLRIDKGLLMGMNGTTSSEMNVTSSTVNSNQFWGGSNTHNMWSNATHLSGLNSSSTTTTSHLM